MSQLVRANSPEEAAKNAKFKVGDIVRVQAVYGKLKERGYYRIDYVLENTAQRPTPAICPEPIANFNRKQLDHEDRHSIYEENHG